MKTAEEFEESIKEKISEQKSIIEENEAVLLNGANDETEEGCKENIFESELVITTLEKILED